MNQLPVPVSKFPLRYKVIVATSPLLIIQGVAAFWGSCDMPLTTFLIGTLLTQLVFLGFLLFVPRLEAHISVIVPLALWMIVWALIGGVWMGFSHECVRLFVWFDTVVGVCGCLGDFGVSSVVQC